MAETGVFKGLSIWLSAYRENPTRKQHKEISGSFDPHITVLSLPNASQNELEEVIDKVKAVAKQHKKFNVKTNKLVKGSTYWQSLFLEINKTDTLESIHQTLKQELGKYVGDLPNPQYYPHVSLHYGDYNDDVYNKIKKSVDEHHLEDSEYEVATIDIYQTSGKQNEWFPLGSAPLGDDVFFRSALFIDNHWVPPANGRYDPVINPATRDVFHYYPAGASVDINKAVASCKDAFKTWGYTDGATRAKYIFAIADEIKRRREEFVKMEILDNGKPLQEARNDVDDTIACFNFYANQALDLDKKQGQSVKLSDDRFSCTIYYEGVGVTGLIVPWNYPLLMATWKVAPMLAAGCTGVLKPSELTPISAMELAAVCKAVGLPAGVLNVITGTGPEAGQPLSTHSDVDKVAFTGSVATGAKVVQNSADQIKRVSLELGGKSPFIVFDDSDVKQATEWIMYGILWNQGQNCSATSRVLIQEGIYDKIIEMMTNEIKKIKIGSGFNPDNKLGPLISEIQYNKVLNYIKSGQDQGAKLLTGGKPTDPELLKGYYVLPTVFTDVKPDMTIWKEEIFGPVLCIRKFKDEEEALKLANDSQYGLASAVMSRDRERCRRFAKYLRTGVVWINCSQPTLVEGPWGGFKKSGTGRELGPWGLEQYLEIKQVTSYLEEGGMGYEWYLKKQ